MTALTTAKRRLARRKREVREAERARRELQLTPEQDRDIAWRKRWMVGTDRIWEAGQKLAEAERQLEEAWHER